MTGFLTALDRATLAADGLPDFAFGYRDRVRFHELDALNHVNNVVFLRWFETLRVEYVRRYGFSGYGTDDPMLVVRRVSADYLKPMFQNEIYTIAARTVTIRPSTFIMHYAVAVDGEVRATGDAVVVSLEQDGKTRRPHRPSAVDAAVTQDGAVRES